tara:strand:+ start:115 stop:447 length:333 start_codon:yes stop_codon:yes gene_type:complete
MILTDSAIAKVWELKDAEEKDVNLRIFVEGGGCSGFQYRFTFDDKINEDDTKMDFGTKDSSPVTILVDPMSLQYLKNATVDYTETIQASQFSIKNPDTKSSCGCGSSFTV